MRRSFPQLILGALAAPLFLFASSASAAPTADACGNIALVATGSCHLDVSGGCTAKCTPITVEAACNGKCDVSVDVSCTGTCNGSCAAQCTAQAAQFDCTASCRSDCEASCDGNCSADKDKTSCVGYCQESCQTNCQAQCKAVPPKADCMAQCQGCCQGSCTSQANFDCSYKCSADIQGGCTADCKAPDGALFCTDQNGRDQYVHVNNLDDCIAYLESNFSIQIQASAMGTCDTSGCKGVGAVSCATAPVGSAPYDVGAIAGAVVGLGLIVSRRRRAK